SGVNYISVRAYDNAGLAASLNDVFYVKKSTAAPRVINNQAGDAAWRSAPGTLYDVDFQDAGTSGLDSAQYKVTTAPGQTGSLIKDWTYIASNINTSAYTADWAVAFAALAENATNYVSVRVWDVSGATTTVNDVFYVKKDVTAPGIANNQAGDDTWRSSNSGLYNVDFTDAGGSALSRFEVKVTTGANQTGTVVAGWYAPVSGINSDGYAADWALAASTFTALPEGIGRVSVRVYDNAGNVSELDDAFYVKKDTTAPSAPAPAAPADLAPLATLAPLFDWTDSDDGSSGVAGYALEVSTSSGFTPLAYSAAPAASQQAGALAASTTYYWRVKARDNAGNYSGYSSAFRVVADTVAPVITDSQPGEFAWRNADAGAFYSVTFADNLTGLDSMEYSAWSGPGQTGVNSEAWTLISSGTPRLSYTAPWGVDFALLGAGTNYISARAWDVAGSTVARADVFTVLKDTFGPDVIDNQAGDAAWRAANPGAVYDVDFRDLYSGVATIQYRINSLPAQGGLVLVDWSDVASGLNTPLYSANWGISAAGWNLLAQGTNYVTVRAYDRLGQLSTLADAFYIKKDTTAPTVADNQPNIPLAAGQADLDGVNVDFYDTGGSLLSKAQYAAWTGAGRTGGEIIPWTDIAAGINAASYTADWPVNYLALPNLATSYVSVRAYDLAGNTTYYNDAVTVYKEGSGPSIINNQPGDTAWRNVNDGVYNVDFQSESGYSLDYFQVTAATSAAAPAYLVAWTSAAWNIGSTGYYADWALPQAVFDALAPGKNYISLKVYDLQPSFSALNNAFYVLKDTSAPTLGLNQAGDAAWQKAAGKTYDVDFFDGLSGLATAQYRITSQPGQAGTVLKDWTDIASPAGAVSYTADWPVDFAALPEWATGYVSVRAFDELAQSSAAADAFYVLKDTTPPAAPSAVSPADQAAYSTATVSFDWTDSADLRSGVAGYALETSLYQDFSSVYASSVTAVSQASLANMPDGSYFWRVRAFDRADNYSANTGTRAFTVDTSSPVLINNQASPTGWLAADPGAVFDVDFRDLTSGVTTAQYRVTSLPAQAGAVLKDWTDILSSTGTLYAPADWQLAFAALAEGLNYVTVRAFDRVALSSTAVDAFVARKDTSAPAVTVGQAGDNTWRRASGAVYDVDFSDLGSGLATAQYRITSLPAEGGAVLKDWTNIFTAAGAASYTADWPVDFFALAETATNYVSVRVYDALGNLRTRDDAFYVLKDVTNPAILDNQPDDNVWRAADPGNIYNVGFSDLGGSKLDRFQTRITTGPAGTGTLISDWTNRILGIGATYYSQPWGPDFAALAEGLNYVSVRVYDNAANSAQQADVFSVRKDTTAPSIIDGQAGDDVWRSANTGTYNVHFADTGGSGLDRFQVEATTDAAGTGTPVFGWTDLVSNINAQAYSSDWALTSELWALIGSGTTYISVRVYDAAGNPAAQTGVFYIRKDTQTVSLADIQAGDDAWRSANTGLYKVDAQALGGSPLDRFEVRSSTLPGNLGPFTSGWTVSVAGLNSYAYSAAWGLPAASFSAMLSGATNYVSVRAYNQAGFYAELADAFYVLKDTVAPQVANGMAGGDLAWRNGPGTLYNVDFTDAGGSRLSGFELRASTNSGAGPYLFEWTGIQSGINADSYAGDFAIPVSSFGLLLETVTNYISVRAYDVAGNTVTVTDAFFILKDTTPPALADNQAGDANWRRSSGTLYNMDFTDTGGSRISRVQVRASPNSGTNGPWYFDWSDAVTGINANSYTADWALTQGLWDLLGEGTNYISVLAWDAAGSSTTLLYQPFYILKDTTVPVFVNGEAGGDAAWLGSGRNYDLDFGDQMSGLAAAQYSVSTTALSADGQVKGWTALPVTAGAPAYAADWPLDFAALKESVTNYVSVRAWDLAGSTAVLTDAFYVKKDTTPPTATDNQAGEFSWRNSNGGSYNVDFADIGGSGLARFQLRASTGPGGTGVTAVDWTDNITGINANSYAVDWPLSAGIWTGLYDSATNYISVRVLDNAGGSFTITDAFNVLKDTTAPSIADNQAGGDAWLNAAGTLYNVDFADGGSLISSAAYAAWTGPGQTGSQSKAWTQLPSVSGASYTADWSVDFSGLAQGFNYISLRAWDAAGNQRELDDVFYIKKDTAAPVISDLQAGDTTWYRVNPGPVFNVDFTDASIGVSTAAYEVWTGPLHTGVKVVVSTNIFAGPPMSAYIQDWGVYDADWLLLAPGTNYITVTAWDGLGHSSAVVDAFYILKDTVPPSAITTLGASPATGPAGEGDISAKWNAVGDNGLTGGASYYLLRYKTSAFADQADFDAAAVYVSTLAPKAAGGLEGMTLTGLNAGVTYYLAVEAVDKAGNAGALSNLTSNYAGVDLTPPGAITDLSAAMADFQGQIALAWTAPGEGVKGVTNAGTATAYIVRYATFAITAANFSAPNVSTFTQTTWFPLAYGQAENHIVDGLTPGATYSIAIKAVDEAGNIGAISNVPVSSATPAGSAAG
ncbi:MAG: hypothetical protein WC822_06165, partial [Candidatus Paceibacterota bacterium]